MASLTACCRNAFEPAATSFGFAAVADLVTQLPHDRLLPEDGQLRLTFASTNSYPLASVASREALMLEKVSRRRPPALQRRPTQAPQRS